MNLNKAEYFENEGKLNLNVAAPVEPMHPSIRMGYNL